MTPKHSEASCVEDNCMEHSGVTTRLNIGIALLSLLCGLFSYSSFVQLPTMEKRIAGRINTIERSIDFIKRDIDFLKLDNARIKFQRNADHPKKDPIQ